MPLTDSSPPIKIPLSVDLLGRLVSRYRNLCIRLGNLESKLLSTELETTEIQSPVYISGLARSGSTILLEILASHPEVATHRYQDFPFIFTPYWWNRMLSLTPFRNLVLQERAHGDGMMVTPESPEAMEEMLWMALSIHDGFEDFYRAHIKKLLLVRKRQRYVAKNNYNIVRLPYLRSLFPDAKFIIPVRDPVTHIASLIRQNIRFSNAGRKDPRITTHMTLLGHHEFGLNRIPIDVGNAERLIAVKQAWENGNEVEGFALYWNMIYSSATPQQNTLIVPFESLYEQPEETIKNLLHACALPEDQTVINRWVPKLRKPDYYDSALTSGELDVIRNITGKTAELYGYKR